MSRTFISTGLRWLWLALIILALDLISKQWVMASFWLGESISIMPFINFFYSYNSGAAFSFLADESGWQRWIFSLIAVVIIVILLVIMYRSDYRVRLSNAAHAMVIGGALGNFFDRIVHGVVIDFIDIYIGSWHWPTFNIADLAICTGTILIILESVFHSIDQSSAK